MYTYIYIYTIYNDTYDILYYNTNIYIYIYIYIKKLKKLPGQIIFPPSLYALAAGTLCEYK